MNFYLEMFFILVMVSILALAGCIPGDVYCLFVGLGIGGMMRGHSVERYYDSMAKEEPVEE